ncbi:MAG TPA: glycosyltransferase family 39 protein [Gammaproteobacteria bacterium]|jgi:4-amino-4-deoxy-L-arabinose transferase-like glycosyltransferase|nr:glycosyltransferase family 39 protein [Gammaproteobacteria bacterium]
MNLLKKISTRGMIVDFNRLTHCTMKFGQKLNIERWFYLFIYVHLLLWTLVPAIVRDNLPMDAIEGSIWGHQLEWGYDKNPYLNGWLTALATWLDGYSDWILYFFSQICVVICLWATFQIAKKILPPLSALLSVCILESVQYYHFHALDFNDNTLELALWSLLIYFFYLALTQPRRWYWIATGLFAGLSMMAKYYTAVLLLPLLILLITDKTHRKQLSTLSPYLGLTIFFIIICPHMIWLFSHDFITINYAVNRVGTNEPQLSNHLRYPLRFLWEQCEVFLPAVGCWLLLYLINKPSPQTNTKRPAARDIPSRDREGASHDQQASLLLNSDTLLSTQLGFYHKKFLCYAAFGPLLTTLLLSFCFGFTLRAGWGMPLLSLWGVALFAFAPPKLSPVKAITCLGSLFALMTIFLSSYSLSFINSDTPSSANFPGKIIARTITEYWHNQYHTPLSYVAGSRWIGGNIEFYSTDHPAVFINWNHAQSPWIQEDKLRQKGGVFVWHINSNEHLPADIQARFPTLTTFRVLTFHYLRDTHHLAPITVGVAILPPA